MTDSRPAQDSRRLSPLQLLAFGFPAMTHALVASPVYSILPAYYATHTTVTLAQIGLVAAASRIIDALNDPVMGYLSDRTRTRWGSRKPWTLAAILFCGGAILSLFSPPATATWVYFLIWSQVLYTGFTMFEVPRSAWGAEISRDYNERSRIGVYVAGFNIAGSLSFYLLPIVLGLLTGSSRINDTVLRSVSWIYLVFMPLGLIAAAILVPQGAQVSHLRTRMIDVWRSVVTCRPAILFFAITVLWGLGQGAFVGVSFIFYTDYMRMADDFPLIMATLFVTEILVLPLWSRILTRFDRHRIWAVCMGAGVLITPLVLLLPRGHAALIPVMALVLARAFFSAPANFLPGAVLGDVIDYDTWKTGANKAGNLFAVQMVLIKIAMAVGGAVSFLVLDRFGYHVGRPNPDAANAGLLIAYLAIPAALHLAMAAACWNFPITRRRHRAIQRRLESRARRLETDPAMTAAV